MAGDDLIVGGLGQDTIFGGDGDDTIIGTAIDDAGADTDTGDFLNGGDGDDTVYAGGGDTIHLGDGSDTLLVGTWVGDTEALVQDFDAQEDKLVVVYDDAAGNDPEVQLVEDDDLPGVTFLVVDGASLLALQNADALTVADVELIGQSTVSAPL